MVSSYAGVRSTREAIAVLSGSGARMSATVHTLVDAVAALTEGVQALATELDQLRAEVAELKAKAAQGLWTP
jgi:hypothetical protein